MNDREQQLRDDILEKTREFVRLRMDGAVRGGEAVPYAGRVYDEHEVVAGVNSMLDFWLTLGPEGDAFEKELGRYLGVRRSVLVNSGSSANLVAISALTSYQLGDRRLLPGSEVITAAAGFPTTVAPILQVGAIPVFVDSDPVTGNIRADLLEEAYDDGKTRAVVAAHTLGNPCDMQAIGRFCERHGLWLVEDNCDALGSRYGVQFTGTFGDLSTQSFYPPHHLTMGEGGAVNIVRQALLIKLVESFRDWGRDCWCASGKDNTCGIRFEQQWGELPRGYDHKYVYSHLGYNLKPTDPQAAIGRAQLKKLPAFVEARQLNWACLRQQLAEFEEFFEFMLPTHAISWEANGFVWHDGAPVVEPSWFGFMLRVRPSAPFSRTELASELQRAGIGNRMLFGGNLVRQPALVNLRKESGGKAFRVAGGLSGADEIMNHSLFVGVYPGLGQDQLSHIVETIGAFCRSSACFQVRA